MLVVTRQLSDKALRFACHLPDKRFAVFSQREHIRPWNLGNSWAPMSEHLPEKHANPQDADSLARNSKDFQS